MLHRLNGHEFEQTLGDGEGQGSLVCCSPWGSKESDTTEWMNWTDSNFLRVINMELLLELSLVILHIFFLMTIILLQIFQKNYHEWVRKT